MSGGVDLKVETRTGYSAVNTAVAVTARIISIVMGFVARVVFTHTLDEGYVGINGLFSDILNILSLAELGVGTAITFALYKPIARKDIRKQQALMQMFKWFYRITAFFVAVTGMALVPFFGVLMKNRPDVDNLVFIYMLYLANSVVSYLLVYKRTLIEAHQMNYIVMIYQTIFLVIKDVLQIIFLITTKNFILYLLIHIACTILGNIFLSAKADRMFPYLKDKTRQKLPDREKHDIYRNIKAMLMHKAGNIVVNNTDNLLISSFVGVVSAGIYSNYYLLIGSVRQLLDQVFQGITASVGNLGATEDKMHVNEIFEATFFAGQWLYGFASICLYVLLNPFVELSFGSRYLFTRDIVLILCINFFINGTRKAVLTFRDSLGLFWYDRYKAVAEAVLNLLFSVILVKPFGVAGIFAGSLVSMLMTSVWIEPYVLYRYHLMQPIAPFFAKYLIYCIVTGIVWAATNMLCMQVTGAVIPVFILRTLICIILPNLAFIIIYHRTVEFAVIKSKINNLLDIMK